jgi:exopolysaccharide biosynthesis protein
MIWCVVGCAGNAPVSQLKAQSPAATIRYSEGLKFKEVEAGIEYGQTISGHASADQLTGPWLINALRIDLSRAQIKAVRALDEGVGLETVSSLAARHNATAAVNGGYFRLAGPYRGDSIGIALVDHKLISEPYRERAEFALTDVRGKTEIAFGHLKFAGEVAIGGARHSVDGVNRPLASDELIVFTPEFHRTTLTNPDGVEIVVRQNRIVNVFDFTGSSRIPIDGFVVSAVGKSRDWLKSHVRKGARVNFSWRLESTTIDEEPDWRVAHTIQGGGPQLIKNGKVAITDKEERMSPTFAAARHPRTAIAKLNSGKLLLVTIDGRQPGVSTGMTLYMLADLLLELGATAAMNLDGGGSTTMVVQQKIVNKPSDQTGERPVSDAILVFSNREKAGSSQSNTRTARPRLR